MDSYIAKTLEEIKTKNANEPEYIQAVEEVLTSIETVIDNHPEYENLGVLERMVEPERIITFRVSWVDDNGKVQVNRAFRVQYSSLIGPYKGGIRLHPSVNQSIMKFLGFEQIFKNALTGLPIGGGKGGCDFDPKGKSDKEIMAFCQAFMTELQRHIGQDVDVPAGDIGTGAREIGYMFGQYKRIRNEFTGVLTGKGLSYGGSLGRTSATGHGLCYFANKMLDKMANTSFAGKKVIVSGAGNVGLYAVEKAMDLGATVVAVNDITGTVYNEKGINFELLKEIKEEKRLFIKDYAVLDKDAKFTENPKDLWRIKCDIALPCATQNELNEEDAKALVNNGVIAVCEGANMPSTPEATQHFINSGVIYGPGKAANAGGVATSGLEMSQNAAFMSWSYEEVDSKLKGIMENIFDNIYAVSKKYNIQEIDLLTGANIAGFEKIIQAMVLQGV